MRVTTEQWRKIQQAIHDGCLAELIGKMLDDAYQEGKEDERRSDQSDRS